MRGEPGACQFCGMTGMHMRWCRDYYEPIKKDDEPDRLASLEARIERLEADHDNLKAAFQNFLEKLPSALERGK